MSTQEDSNDSHGSLHQQESCSSHDVTTEIPPPDNSFWSLVKKTRIEPLAFLTAFASITSLLAYQQLVQDKLCRQEFNQTSEFCYKLSSLKNSDIKNKILAKASTFMLQREFVGLIPNVFMSIYCGCWCDKFKNGMRYILYVAYTGQIIEATLLTLNCYYFDLDWHYLLFTGLPTQMMGYGIWVVVFGYISTNFPQDQRAYRFLLLDICVNASVALAYYLGGVMLSADKFILKTPASALHNYADTFIIGGLCNVFLYFWIFFFIPPQSQELDLQVSDSSGNIQDESIPGDFGNNGRERGCFSRLRDIFTLSHFKRAYETIIKKRPLNLHRTLWWMLLYLNLITLPILGSIYIYYPLVEKLYQWDYVMYSRMQTVTQVMKPIATLLIVPPIFKFLKLRVLQVSMVGCMSSILGGIALASLTRPIGFYIFMMIGCIQGIGAVGVRAFLTQFIPKDEISTLFSILLTIEIVQPFVGSVIYSNLFAMTIDFYPTFAFHFTSFLVIIALMIVCRIDLLWGGISVLPPKNSVIVSDPDDRGQDVRSPENIASNNKSS